MGEQHVQTKRPDHCSGSQFRFRSVCNPEICATASENDGAAAYPHQTAETLQVKRTATITQSRQSTGGILRNLGVNNYVGRSDECVHDRLCDHVPLDDPEFKFNYCASVEAAFYAECELYHTFGGKRNPNHPARPAGTRLRCPRLDCPV